jgi:predicted MFS family arabinose efflux permease
MAACGAFFMGQFALFTYLRPFLETVTLVDATSLSLILLVIGVTGLGGTLFIGSLLKKGLYRTLFTIPVLMAVIALALIPAGSWVVPVAILLGLWGLMATAAPVGWWSWIAQVLPNDAEAGGGLMVAVVQLAIASGSTLGGWLFDNSGYQSTFTASAAILLLGAALTVLAMRAQTGQPG